jgi:6-phospho-3-hexuloisomerase
MEQSYSYAESRSIILEELRTALQSVASQEVDAFVHMICDAENVFVVGVGRVLLMLQAFSKRLNHLGISSYYVGEVNEPAITPSDILVVGSGSGESVVPLQIVKLAYSLGVKVVHIGSNRKSSMAQYEHLFVRIPCRTKLELSDEIPSQQPMSSLFEQSVLILGDILACMIMQKKQITDMHALWKQHANLE